MKNSDCLDSAVKYWWEKAEESLESAERELHVGSLTFAVNRLYYSLFYAVSAMLLSRGYKKVYNTSFAVMLEFNDKNE